MPTVDLNTLPFFPGTAAAAAAKTVFSPSYTIAPPPDPNAPTQILASQDPNAGYPNFNYFADLQQEFKSKFGDDIFTKLSLLLTNPATAQNTATVLDQITKNPQAFDFKTKRFFTPAEFEADKKAREAKPA